MSTFAELPNILIGELGRTSGLVLAWFNIFKISGLIYMGKFRLPGKAGFPN